MPSVKIPKKSTATDMTPFVDVAFLILSFFIMATKFKPPQPVEITTPKSVSSEKLKEQDAVLIEMDKKGRVFFTVNTLKSNDVETKRAVIENVNKIRNLGLTEREFQGFVRNTTVGVPLAKLKSFLGVDDKSRVASFEGIPVLDSTNNELQVWVSAAASAFQGRRLNFMIKGDNNAKYPAFKGVIEAMRKNDVFKYQLITDPEGVPEGSDLYMSRRSGKGNDNE
jgi:biopolymer transport protein ExbD